MCQSTSDNIRLWIIVLITTCDNHYYDEDNITVGNPIDCKVVVNHTVELTEEEKAQARKDAIRRVHEEAYAKLSQSKSRTVQKQPEVQQTTLF